MDERDRFCGLVFIGLFCLLKIVDKMTSFCGVFSWYRVGVGTVVPSRNRIGREDRSDTTPWGYRDDLTTVSSGSSLDPETRDNRLLLR